MTRPVPVQQVVVDTDVLSFLFNQDPVRAARYQRHLHHRAVLVPFIALAEMRFGASRRNRGAARQARLAAFLSGFAHAFPDAGTCAVWATVRAAAQRTGRVVERQDAWIAAIAISLNLPLVTHNASHYAHIPLLQTITEPDR